jgi:hypothetical protein
MVDPELTFPDHDLEELVVAFETPAPREPADEILARFGRRGGPSAYGWSKREGSYACSRRGKWEAKYGRPAGSSRALVVGSVVHEYLAEWYSAVLEGRLLSEAEDKILAMHEALVEGGYETEADIAWRCWAGYRVKYAAVDSYLVGQQIVSVEQELKRDFPWGGTFTARADLVIKAPDGYIVVDHKTNDRLDGWFAESWMLSPQMLGLQYVAARAYRPIVGYSINGIIKTKPPKYTRNLFVSSPRLVRDWMRMMRYREAEARMAAAAGHVPNLAVCWSRYRCPFWECCAHGTDPAVLVRRPG